MHFSGRTGKESGDEQSADGDEFLGPKNGAGEEWVGEGQEEGRKEGEGWISAILAPLLTQIMFGKLGISFLIGRLVVEFQIRCYLAIDEYN